jgi:hypothetical protein
MEKYEPIIIVQISSSKTKKLKLLVNLCNEVRTITSKVNLCKNGAASIGDIKPIRLVTSYTYTLHLRCLRLVNV